MARRGRCRCGTVLAFEQTGQGYKTKCNICGAIVRLQLDKPAPADPSPFSDLGSLPESEPQAADVPQPESAIPSAGGPQPDPASWLVWGAVGLAFIVVAIGVAVVYAN